MAERTPLDDLTDRLARLEARQTDVELRADLDAIGAAIAGQTAWLEGHAAALTTQSAWLQGIEQGLADLGSAHTAALTTNTAWLKGIEHGLADLGTAHGAQLRDMGRWLASTTQTVSSLSSTPVISSPTLQALGPRAQLVDHQVTLARMLQVWTVVRWLAQAPVESDTLISVVIPTRNRLAYLTRAIDSVLAQRHTRFEIVVVNDGSTDETASFLAGLADSRIRALRTTGVGTSAARNIGLEAARGTIITHLDDDNLMDPLWLRGVAWGFDRWPDTELLYGARIIEDGAARDGVPSGAMPALEWLPFDRKRLEQSNYIDMNVLAHRAGLPEARFDPALRSSIEWDMLLRLTATRAPLELPVIACLYSNYAPNRLSDRLTYLQENRIVRSRIHTTRPMRVLSYNALFPLMSETYIEEEMLALEAQGASVAFAAYDQSVSPYPVRQTIYSGLDEAIAGHDPDVIIVYWTSHALGELDHLKRVGRPFALRVHSFDFDIADVMRVRDHPACVGVWAFPHHAAEVPGAHTLVPIFTTHAAMPPPAQDRTLVASISAGLPKKDWPLLFGVMDQVSDLERMIVLARSNGFEHVPDDVVEQAAGRPHPPTVTINMPRAEVFEVLSRTAVLLYTVVPDLPLGMPMSVIEGMRAGACVIAPDRPEMRALCGDGFRPYTTASDIVAHIREIMAGGDAIDSERHANRDRALACFCDPALGRRFHDELSAAVRVWRGNRDAD
ncbi:glycosyltransferase [Acidisoma cladoniae]|uniref:glycosyltransferase n=1 Tax=Acidisoma cladoniae TaxID=3040935 RepID=UPI00254F4BDA|nr:glycosyltransferase [Acidisoma sp. PAMC 29798]